MRSPKNYLILFLALATFSSATLAWRQYHELIRLRAAAGNPPDLAALRARAALAERRVADLQAELADTGAKVAMSPKPAEPDPGPTEAENSPDSATNGRRMRGRVNTMDRPEMQRLMALQRKRALGSRYAELFRSLNLPADQLEKLQNLLVDRGTSRMDVMDAARSQGLNMRSDYDAINQLATQAEANIDAEIRNTLGETAYAKYQEYERTLPQRSTVTQLEQQLSYSSTPLTRDQSAALLSILASNAQSPTPAASGRRPSRGAQTTITDEIINQTLGVLAAPQVEALRQLQQEQHAQEELNQAMRNPAVTTPALIAPPSGG